MDRHLVDQLRHLLHPLKVRIANSIARAVVQVVDDDAKLQLLQLGVLSGETLDEAERFQEYGLSSRPLKGAEAVAIFPGGDRGHPLVVAVDDRRHRPTGLQPGEVAVYNDAGGILVKLTADGELLLGGDDAADPVGLQSDHQTLYDAISNAVPLANDGGAQLQEQILAALDAAGYPVSSSKVKGK